MHCVRGSLLSLILGALLWGALAPEAVARSMVIEEMHADLTVNKDSTLDVVETFRVSFRGFYNGIFRVIPYGTRLNGFFRDAIKVDVTAVTDERGNALEYWKERAHRRGRMRLKIRVPGAKDATRVVKIAYTVQGAIRTYTPEDENFGHLDELQWNVTGVDWEIPFRKAGATVHLPKTVKQEEVQITGFTGPEYSKGKDYKHTWRDAHTVQFETTRELRPREGLTIGTFFPTGHVAHAGPIKRAFTLLKANWFLLIPMLMLLLAIRRWWNDGRDSLAGRTIIPEYDPPGELRAAEVGFLADNTVHPHDMTAAIVDLAVRGHLQLREAADDADTPGMEVRIVDDPPAGDALRGWEQELIDGFEKGTKADDGFIPLSSLRRKFSARIDKARTKLANGMVKDGYYPKAPSDVTGASIGSTMLLLIVAVVLGMWRGWGWPYFVCLAVAAVIMFWIARYMPQRTKKGLDALARIKGMEEYLETAESDRMDKMTLRQLERLLPYAIALGLHEKWVKHIQPLYEQPPEWYDTRGKNWSDVRLGRGFRGLHFSVGDSLYAAPRVQSSRSSGGWSRSWGGGTSSGGGSWSGGGGFSGGGFGGGGGGGW